MSNGNDELLKQTKAKDLIPVHSQEYNDYHVIQKYQSIIDKKKTVERMRIIQKEAQLEIDKYWSRFPTAEETELVVRLVEELGYRVKSTIPLKHGLVGITFTESTEPKLRKNWGSISKKFKKQPLLEVFWENISVSESKVWPYSGLSHYELWFCARINTRLSFDELRERLEKYANQ